MRKQKAFTVEQHQQLAKGLRPLWFIELSCEVPNRYGQSHPAGKAAIKAHLVIEKLRSELDNLYCAEYGSRSPYYGWEAA